MRRNVWLPGLLLLVLAGCGGGGGSSSDGGSSASAPTISLPTANPGTLNSTGGSVTISATVQDSGGVAWVRASVTRPDSGVDVVVLGLVSGNSYQATYTIPRNTGSNDVLYNITIAAADAQGNVSQPMTLGSVRVLGDVSPPPPPAL